MTFAALLPWALAFLVAVPAVARGQSQPDDLQALGLQVPESAASTAAPASDTDSSYELQLAPGYTVWRGEAFAGATPNRYDLRTSGAVQLTQRWGSHVRFVLSDQMDVRKTAGTRGIRADDVTNTLREAYVSLGTESDFLDLGRFNEKLGVAYGYNPTDVFRHFAVISSPSADPAALRSNRLGSVGVRYQHLAPGTTYEALFLPRITQRPDSGPLSAHLARSNSDSQGLLRVARTVSERTLLEGIVHWSDREKFGAGVNLSSAIGERTVFYVEYTKTRAARLDQRALSMDPDAPYRAAPGGHGLKTRSSTGLSIALSPKAMLELEYEHDSSGLDRETEYDLAHPRTLQQLRDYIRLRNYANDAQDLLSRHYLFVRLNLRSPFGSDTAMSVFSRINMVDRSAFNWLELSKQKGRMSYAVDIAAARGRSWTEFGNTDYATAIQFVVAISL